MLQHLVWISYLICNPGNFEISGILRKSQESFYDCRFSSESNKTTLLCPLNSHRETGKYLWSTSVISRPYDQIILYTANRNKVILVLNLMHFLPVGSAWHHCQLDISLLTFHLITLKFCFCTSFKNIYQALGE